jgi:hypothetical protein
VLCEACGSPRRRFDRSCSQFDPRALLVVEVKKF